MPLTARDVRGRVLAAIARAGPRYRSRRAVVLTLSIATLAAVPATGLARVDLWGGAHRVLGRPATAVEGVQGVVVAMAGLYALTFLSNTVAGRFFCGWGCPVGHASRLGESVDLRARRAPEPGSAGCRPRTDRARWFAAHAAGAAFVAAFVAAAMTWWVDPRVVTEGSWTARAATLGVFAVLWAGGFGHAFAWRWGFCRSACPVGLYYRYVTSRAPVGIVLAEDADPCTDCSACTRVCPVGLEPRKLLAEPVGADDRFGDAECLRCGDCVEACRMVFLRRPGASPPLRFGRTRPVEARDEPADAVSSEPANTKPG